MALSVSVLLLLRYALVKFKGGLRGGEPPTLIAISGRYWLRYLTLRSGLLRSEVIEPFKLSVCTSTSTRVDPVVAVCFSLRKLDFPNTALKSKTVRLPYRNVLFVVHE